MRKISPEDVKDDFRAQLADLAAFHATGFAAFSREADQSSFTEQSLLAAAVTWEGFVSDMFVACINRDATRFKEHLRASFDEHLKTGATPKRVFEMFGTVAFPQHLTKAQVQAIADGAGNNITFPNFDQIEQKAASWLVAEHARRFTSLSAQQKAIVDSLIALRNHIAHRSQRSLDAMNEILARGALHATGIRRQNYRFHNVGAWLKAKPPGHQSTRFSLVMTTLDSIGAAL